MDRKQADELLTRAIDNIREHFDDVQVFATRVDENGLTESMTRGKGNFYARLAMADEFVSRSKAHQAAYEMLQLMPRPSDPNDDWKK